MHTEHPASNPEIQYEKTDAHPRPLYHFLFWICVVALFTAAFSWAIWGWAQRFNEKSSVARTMAVPRNLEQPPAPRLQTREVLDLQAFQAREEAILTSYGPSDPEKGLYRIPIEEAMRLTVERGLPTVPGVPAAPVAPAVSAAAPAATPSTPAAAPVKH